MRVAIVGSGIAGAACGWLLQRAGHEVRLFEADSRPGGHVHTHRLERPDGIHHVDSGFIVFNERTYPLFTRLLHELGVPARPSDMSFSVRADAARLEYRGAQGGGGLFAQRRNLLRPRFWGMLRDLLRFYRQAPGLLASGQRSSLGAFLCAGGYGDWFVDYHLRPMAAAVWSTPPAAIDDMPAEFLIRFFHNHGFLQLRDRPRWYTVAGGSQRYHERLVAPLGDRLHLGTPVRGLRRAATGVRLRTDDGEITVDHCILACHSDQALARLEDPDPAESRILSAVRFRAHPVALHTDTRVLPRRRGAWASWNARVEPGQADRIRVTYDMNILQGLRAAETFCVSLNEDGDSIAPERALARMRYAHPQFDDAAVVAQQAHHEIDNQRHTSYVGAWWRNGFHEDGLWSAVRSCARLGVSW
ncbi:MAG: NAD(P)/FAD-dependent oxidoreductase [Planctomycetota bacterium]